MSHHSSHSGHYIRNYGVWVCTPIGFRMGTRETDSISPHIHLFFTKGAHVTNGRHFRAAINVKSRGPESRLVFWHRENFQHSIVNDLSTLEQGFYPLPLSSDSNMSTSLEGLDYIRTKDLISNFPADGELVEHDVPGEDNDLLDKIRPILCRAIEERAVAYLFGSQYDSSGIHDVHMNQGSLPNFDNGVYQDGAIIFQFDHHWEAVFLAFGSQRTPTDDETGLPFEDSISLAIQLGSEPLTPERG